MTNPLVSIESPFAMDPAKTIPYAHRACLDALRRGESPYASHLMFPQFLDDTNPTQRELGLFMSDLWRRRADKFVFYLDLGWSLGMGRALDLAKQTGQRVEFRALDGPIPADVLAKLGLPVRADQQALPFDMSLEIDIDISGTVLGDIRDGDPGG